MKSLNDYRIAFVGLKNGIHYFNYEIGADFFAEFEDSPIGDGQLFVDVALDKSARVFTITFDIGGLVKTECDRCLEAMELPVAGHFKVFVRTSGRDLEVSNDLEEEDVIIIPPESSHLDLSSHIYEFILLSQPLTKTCDEDPDKEGCNAAVLDKLHQSEPEEQAIDPRWEKLKSIKKK